MGITLLSGLNTHVHVHIHIYMSPETQHVYMLGMQLTNHTHIDLLCSKCIRMYTYLIVGIFRGGGGGGGGGDFYDLAQTAKI